MPVFPPALGRWFPILWSTSAITNLGDGTLLAAGPLLVASVSDEPLAVAGAVTAQQLPWLLFGLVSGALVDRLDRKRLVAGVNALRGSVLGLLASAVWFDVVSLPILYAALFLLGTGETLADNAAGALLVRLVPRAELGRANARLTATFTVGNQLLGPPFGALLFAAGAALPFTLDAVAYLLAAVLVARIATPSGPASQPSDAPLTRRIAEGMRWLWQHAAMRALAVTIAVMNVTFMAAFATWVLYARELLGLSEAQFGLLATAGAVGGLAGSSAYGWLERRIGRAAIVRWGLVVEGLTHVVLAAFPQPVVVFVTMTVFGIHAVVWGTVAATVRQRAVPDPLLGRVTSVYLLASVGGAAVGSVVGGGLAQALGLTAPFWIAAGAVGVLVVAVWRPLGRVG